MLVLARGEPTCQGARVSWDTSDPGGPGGRGPSKAGGDAARFVRLPCGLVRSMTGPVPVHAPPLRWRLRAGFSCVNVLNEQLGLVTTVLILCTFNGGTPKSN